MEIRQLRVEDETPFLNAINEFADDVPPWEFAFEYHKDQPFEAYVKRVNGWKDGIGLKEGFVPSSFLVAVIDGKIIGRVSIRHHLNEFLREYNGHIGYGVVPSERKKGYASEMLSIALRYAHDLGIERVLISCDADNIGSRKVIEKNGGEFEKETDFGKLDKPVRIYWIRT